MKFENRFLRLSVAVAIVGIVAAQVPMRTSIAQAQDNYPAKKDGFFEGNSGVILGAIVLGAASGAVINTGKAAGAALGNVSLGAIGGSSLYDTFNGKADDYSILANLIRNAEQIGMYRTNGPLTIFAPSNAALTKVFGADGVAALQTPAKQAEAKQLLSSITVKGAYTLADLKAAAMSGKILESLSGQSITLKLTGDTLTANGVEILGNEVPSSNGAIISSNGVVSAEG